VDSIETNLIAIQIPILLGQKLPGKLSARQPDLPRPGNGRDGETVDAGIPRQSQ
jgi:hypothetical protein